MGSFLKELAAQLAAIWKKIGINQRVSIILLLVVSVVGLWIFATLAKRPTFALLYKNLSQGDAAKVVEQLRDEKVAYRLKNSGRTVYVPSSKVHEMRLAMASQGLPAGKTVGFSEMFDKGGFGKTEFELEVAFLRAQQGELARTIASLDPITDASVTIVRPEKALFSEQEEPATASVMVRLRGGSSLNAEQINAIRYLVASAVEALAADKVTIITSDMKVLARASDGESPSALTTSQMELTQHLEQYYAREAQAMLDKAIGPDNAIIRVALSLDFEALEKTSRISREGATLREKTSKTKVDGGTSHAEGPPGAEANVIVGGPPASGSATGGSESEQTIEVDYMPSIDETRLVKTPGAIQRLTASALINSERKDTSLTVEDFEDIVKGALPFDASRGDLITVREVAFHRREAPPAAVASAAGAAGIMTIARHAMTAVLVIVLLLFFRSMFKRAKLEVPTPARQREATRVVTAAEPEEEAEVLLPEPLKMRGSQQQIHKLVEERPEMVANLIREWLRE